MASVSQNIPKIAGVCERDIDLLLLEEFMASPDFCKFFISSVGQSGSSYSFVECTRSVTDGTGESDVEVVFEEQSGERLLCLLENKVNASFQPQQAERYRERGNNYRRSGKCHHFITILFAPTAYYKDDKKGFDVRLNYERVRGWFAQSSLADGRKRYKVALLNSAIEKSSSGYQKIADASVTKFWRDYWRLCKDEALELGMREPANKPASATYIYFYEADLPKEVDLVHKLNSGYFDLQFSKMGEKLQVLRSKYGAVLDRDMDIVRATGSASIRLKVPELKVADTVEAQRDDVLKSLQAGRRLLRWAHANHLTSSEDINFL